MSFRSLESDPEEKVIAYRHDAHRYPVDAAGNRSAAPNATNQLAQLNRTRYRWPRTTSV